MSLTNTNVQKSVRNVITDYLKSVNILADLNSVLSPHVTYPGGKPVITTDNIYSGKRPDRRNIRNFPAITVVSNSRSTEWYASRTTEDTLTLRIFCCVLYTDNSEVESLMEDFTDAVVSTLYKQTKFSWNVVDPINNLLSTSYAIFDAKPTSITYGSVDSGFLRAGQIEWQGRMLVSQNDSF